MLQNQVVSQQRRVGRGGTDPQSLPLFADALEFRKTLQTDQVRRSDLPGPQRHQQVRPAGIDPGLRRLRHDGPEITHAFRKKYALHLGSPPSVFSAAAATASTIFW